MLGQIISLAHFGHERHLLVYVLVSTGLDQSRHEEHVGRFGRLIIFKNAVFEVLKPLVARASIWCMLLEGEAFADTPQNRAIIAEVDCEFAPLDHCLPQLLEQFRVIDQDGPFLFSETAVKLQERGRRGLGIHGSVTFPCEGNTLDQSGREKVGVYSQPFYFPS